MGSYDLRTLLILPNIMKTPLYGAKILETNFREQKVPETLQHTEDLHHGTKCSENTLQMVSTWKAKWAPSSRGPINDL